jgi:glycosyl hydrolase family 2
LRTASQPQIFDEHGVTSLDGTWDFYPGEPDLGELEALEPKGIWVPGLWEAQGYVELDGPAWYRRTVELDSDQRFWTLRFGAVMDLAEVYWNDTLVGVHESPFTPFELDLSGAIRPGENILAVRVVDPPLGDPEHLRLAHGKQGWANHHFPSRPSLYMTYGGIWQSVTLQRHGPVVATDVFVQPDPDDLLVAVELENRSDRGYRARLGVRTLGLVWETAVDLGAEESATLTAELGATAASRWQPDQPVLQQALVDVVLDDGTVSHTRAVRYGLRTVRIDGEQMLINDVPYRMKSALVQGFRPDTLYAEGTRAEIEDEVRAAKEMGFNTLRLHIKGFEPRYLDVCDELGMLLQCDLPVAEPIAHDELGDDTLLARRSVTAVEEQIRRDRNHPSIVLWAAMNELCLDRIETRYTEGYERFAETLTDAVERSDPTRPYIENDWIEPEPERVFRGPVLTAHWYGRLHADYLATIERKAAESRGLGKPLFVTEYGDWGLPEMPELADPPFWDSHGLYAAALANTRWPGTIGRFVAETQRYQGLSDRLQTEVFRRHQHLGGYCLTELTDVPLELNGLLDLNRRPKPLAVAEVRRANQTVLPMLRLESLVVAAGGTLSAPLHVANDGPEIDNASIEARFGDSAGPRTAEELLRLDTSGFPLDEVEQRFRSSVVGIRVGRLEACSAVELGTIDVTAPVVPGSHDLVVTLRSGGDAVAENRYPIHVVVNDPVEAELRLLGEPGATAAALERVGTTPGELGPTVVAEGALDEAVGEEVRRRLASGEDVLVLAQLPEAASSYPVQTTITAVETNWGSSVFHFTTDHGALASLPRRAVLTAEDSTVQARSIVSSVDGCPFPETPVVIAYKPVPWALTGTIVGCQPAGPGRLFFCQYQLAERAADGDAAAQAVLGDLLRWVAWPRKTLMREQIVSGDGRAVRFYRFGTGRRP